MFRIPATLIALVLGGAILVGTPGVGWPANAPTAPDNTKVNRQDRQQGAVTADQQKENSADRELARRVRRAFTADKGLSTYAKNVKIIARDGTVTLKGPVRSEAEKQQLETKAAEVAGDGKVTSELTVAPKQG